MRILLIITIILNVISGNSQVVVDSVSGNIYIDRVQEIDLSKKDLYEKTNRWVAKAYNNSNHVIRINNEDNIVTKGAFSVGAYLNYGKSGKYSMYLDYDVDYTLDLKFKEGRYKIEISGLSYSAAGKGSLFFNYETYKALNVEAYENYSGPGKKLMKKRIENDEELRKEYHYRSVYEKEIISQIKSKLESIDSSLLNFLKAKEDNEDW